MNGHPGYIPDSGQQLSSAATAVAEAGRLPSFLIIGAMKSATTSLARYLGAHPQVFMVPQKELHYFDRLLDRGEEWYRRQFAAADGRPAAGEATPDYMYFSEVPALMARTVPQARLIAILRDPVDRAYSHYWHERARGRERLEFAEAVAAEPDRLASRDPDARRYFSYIDRGRYLRQLQRVCQYYPRESLLVLLADDLYERPLETFQGVCRFLGVDDAFLPANVGQEFNQFIMFRSLWLRDLAQRLYSGPHILRAVARLLARANNRRGAYPPLDPEIRAQVGKLFEEENAALAAWLGRDLSAWGRPRRRGARSER